MANYGSAALAMKNEAPALSGEVFGALINLSGRRRFTSQRLVLYAVLAGQGQENAAATAREALALFRGAHHALVNGSDTVPGIFCPELEEVYFGRTGGDRQIQDFMGLAERTLEAAESAPGSPRAAAQLAQLVEMTTPVLALLNQITAIYEEQSKKHALLMKKQLRGVITEIETIAKQAKMVSFNARIVAARAGFAGREFAVVAGVLSNITGEIDDMVKAALTAANA
ncbi:methyl-accepting chemotaxis protein [Pseudoduganella aquatica]|uniref:Methyl-accepting chemotaxis protein n=1 Tax=Pseudoduganella aquatica TaxID=2660641 RepID=A0A7X4KKX6_9BURK|nr:methyl-accepting chemotaxis protein [Pseudoduganella aquatica]MYN06493.1 methyl-accepting chemotaxis protein [Pseudoduganella aquatica]